MLKKHGLLAFLAHLGLFGSYVVENEGAGGDGANDEFDDEFDDANPDDDNSNDDNSNDDNSDDDNSDETSKRIADLEKKLEEQEQDKLYHSTISEIKEKHKDFDENKIKNFLSELHKTDPQKAKSLNNPLGWEVIHNDNFSKKAVDNDNPNFGRNVDPVERATEVFEAVKSGTVTLADEQDVMGKLL